MPPIKGPMIFTLTDPEVDAIKGVDLAGQPGEELHKQVCGILSNGNRELPVTEVQLGRLFRVMVWGAGPLQYMAARIFKRSLMQLLTQTQPAEPA